jgi:hypothetical protein
MDSNKRLVWASACIYSARMAEYLKRHSKTCQLQVANASPLVLTEETYVQTKINKFSTTVCSTISDNSEMSSHENDDAYHCQQPVDRQPSSSQQYTINSLTCQRGSARQCSKSHMHFKGKSSFLTPSSPQINHQIDMKIGTFDYVQGFNKCAKFHRATFRGSAPTHR